MLRKCAFLTMDSLEGFMHYDYLLKSPLKEKGWEVSDVSWRDPNVDWNRFEAVLIRTPWDYQDEPARFLQVLEEIDRSGARLENPLELIRWNIDKGYLKELERKGIPIVPTRWGPRGKPLTRERLEEYFGIFDTDELIIKPLVSANADDTFRLSRNGWSDYFDSLQDTFRLRAWLAQPFVNNIVSEGEFSLNYFGGYYSHALLKTPKQGDFRVQEEHGGHLKSIEPEDELKELGDRILSVVNPTPLYARADIVRTQTGFALMELELIEPSLYFNMDSESPVRFARVFEEWMREKV